MAPRRRGVGAGGRDGEATMQGAWLRCDDIGATAVRQRQGGLGGEAMTQEMLVAVRHTME